MTRLIGLLTALLGLCVCASAHAQSGPLIIDRSRPDRAPAAAGAAPKAPAAVGDVRAETQGVSPFAFSALDVQGSTLPPAAFAPLAQPLVGKTIGRQDVVRLAEAVGAVYAKSDVALYSVLVPNQTFAGGVVRLRVIEGYVTGVQVTPQPDRPAPHLTQAYADALTGQQPLSKSALERQLGLMREIPGATPDIQILQGDKPGAVRLAVKPQVKRFEANLSVNSRGASMLGRNQIEVGLHANSVLREGDRTDLTLAFPTEIERFQYVSVAHREPVGDQGAAVTVSAGYLRTKPKIAGFELAGTAKTAGVTAVYPIIRSNTRNLYLTGGLDGLDSDNALFGRLLSRERSRTVRAAAAWSEQKAKSVTTASLSLSKGLDGLGARMADPRFSESDFAKANVALTRAVYSERYVLRLAASGQVTGDRLPASEKFAVGGAQFGRAFASAVISGDSGYAASIEAALRQSSKALPFQGSELYAFADYGQVVQAKALPLPDDEVASAGIGVRIAVSKRGIVELEAAKALNDVSSRNGVRAARLMINFRSAL